MNLLETSFVLGQRMVFSNVLIERFVEGGLSGMILILLCLLLAAFFSYKAFANLNGEQAKFLKYKKLINQVVLLGLVISFANSLMGLIQGFDALEASGGAESAILAGGLKITLLSPLFGLIVFILGYTATFVLSWMREANPQEVA
jgi:magnesium-transporting ATPase (P-type)